jgi:hypothetical protein
MPVAVPSSYRRTAGGCRPDQCRQRHEAGGSVRTIDHHGWAVLQKHGITSRREVAGAAAGSA